MYKYVCLSFVAIVCLVLGVVLLYTYMLAAYVFLVRCVSLFIPYPLTFWVCAAASDEDVVV